MNIRYFGACLAVLLCAGCSTSADMAYKYQDNAGLCVKLGREIARQEGDSKHNRELNRRYYQNCVGK